MNKKDDQESRHKLTDGIENDHTKNPKAKANVLSSTDPRIIELVRFLARTAAEKDYAELIAKTRRETENGSEKKTLQ